jgi:hypothetical protein
MLQWKHGHPSHDFTFFEDVLAERGDEILQKLREVIVREAEKDEVTYENIPYSMSGTTEWKRLAAVKL